MEDTSAQVAQLIEDDAHRLTLAGAWTARGLGILQVRLEKRRATAPSAAHIEASGINALDTAGAWELQSLLQNQQQGGAGATLSGLRPEFAKLLVLVTQRRAELATNQTTTQVAAPGTLAAVGVGTMAALEQVIALLAFVGQIAVAAAGCVAHPKRLRVRPILYQLRSAGVDALPIVGLLSLLLGVVVAYQGADQLRRYGANIFVADLVGLSMLREFAPLITAIIAAGRSGSAYAAQIGTMTVTEEIDAMRTIGIVPMELLVLPKLIALVIALPLLTVFADILGVFGGMLMADAQLGVGYQEFLARFVKAVSPTAYLIGVGKAPVYAIIITTVGCFQGFRTRGGADSVGRQTTRSVVQAIFLVIVADALFSVAFSVLDL